MNQPQYLLLPASPLFIAFTLTVAFLLNLMPWGTHVGVPDFVALVLVFWGIRQPRKVGIGVAFFMGLLMDVHSAALLGEHALAYTLLSHFAIMIHKRVLWFRISVQALHVWFLLAMTHLVQVLVEFVVSGRFGGFLHFIDSVVSAALWPLLTVLLMAPQRRAVDRDHTRPL